MKRKSPLKKILISVTAVVLVAALGLGVWQYAGSGSGDPVNVYEFQFVGMTEYWGDSQESYGFVQTDRIQTVFLSSTQTVTEVFVSQGDQVKKGDVLLEFDTTLSDLSLERKRLAVEKLKLQLEDAKKRLAEINSMRPMVIPVVPDVEPDANLGVALNGSYQISDNVLYDGSTKEKALICWLSTDGSIDDALLNDLFYRAEAYQTKNAQQAPSSASAVDSTTTPVPETTLPPAATVPPTTQAPPATQAPPETTVPPGTQVPPETTVPPATEVTPETTVPPATEIPPETTLPPTTEIPPETTLPPVSVNVEQFYVVFKVTEGNMSLGNRNVWQGMLVKWDQAGGQYRMQFFNASAVPDHMLSPGETETPLPEIDFGSGFTAAQIAQMRSEQQRAIKEVEFNIKMAEAEYKIMQTEMVDGKVYAQIDGTVIAQTTPEEALLTQQPLLKVSGGGGFFIDGSISELDRADMQLGQEVTINDWNTGMTYTGTVQSLGDYPSADGYWNGMGNPTATYYPFRVFVDESSDLQEGSYVNITFSAGTSEHGIYLQNPFLRTEGGRSYVFVQGVDGKLEQRFVTTGKSLWGSYTEILEGLSETDLVAFPYGKNVKDGAQAVAADINELYQ